MSPFAILLGLSAVFGLGDLQLHGFERAAAMDIRSRLSGEKPLVSVTADPAGLLGALTGDILEVKIAASEFSITELPLFTEPDRTSRGRVRNLNLELSNFTLAGLRIESLKASIPNCRYDLGLAMRHKQIRLSRSGEGVGEVVIKARDLETYILSKFKEIKNVHVEVEYGSVTVSGYGEFLVAKTGFSVRASLTPMNRTQLLLTNARISFDGGATDDTANKVLLDTLNPVVDLKSDLHLFDAIDVTEVIMEPGEIRARGKTRIPVKPGETRNGH